MLLYEVEETTCDKNSKHVREADFVVNNGTNSIHIENGCMCAMYSTCRYSAPCNTSASYTPLSARNSHKLNAVAEREVQLVLEMKDWRDHKLPHMTRPKIKARPHRVQQSQSAQLVVFSKCLRI